MRIQTQNPSRLRGFRAARSNIVCRRRPRPRVHDPSAVLPSDPHGRIPRAMVHYKNVIAGIERLQRAAQPQSIVLCEQQCRNRSHSRKCLYGVGASARAAALYAPSSSSADVRSRKSRARRDPLLRIQLRAVRIRGPGLHHCDRSLQREIQHGLRRQLNLLALGGRLHAASHARTCRRRRSPRPCRRPRSHR